MDTEPSPEDSEKPRYLLPDGCKDLIDALRVFSRETEVPAESPDFLHLALSGTWGIPDSSAPTEIPLPGTITVGDLATLLQRKPFEVIAILLKLNHLANSTTELDFATAAAVCIWCGVSPTKAG